MPEPALQATALRYAAGDLAPADAAAFEARLADDQDARDALGEAVRLSAAALGQVDPEPHPSVRALLRARLSWTRARGLAWAAGGAAVVAVCTLVGLSLADRPAPAPPAPEAEAVPAAEVVLSPHEPDPAIPDPDAASAAEPGRSVAEIWADLSTPEHVEKTRDDEARLRQRMHTLSHPHPVPVAKADAP